MIEGDIRREMTVDTDQKYQEKVEAATKVLCELKQIYQLNKGHDDMAIPYVEEFFHVSSYPLIESMGFYTDISDEVAKMRAATLLEEIVCLHQLTKNMLKYVHKNSNYGHLVSIPASDTQE